MPELHRSPAPAACFPPQAPAEPPAKKPRVAEVPTPPAPKVETETPAMGVREHRGVRVDLCSQPLPRTRAEDHFLLSAAPNTYTGVTVCDDRFLYLLESNARETHDQNV